MANFAKLVSFLFLVIACNPVPGNENEEQDGGASPIACTKNSECGSGICNVDLGTCEGKPGVDGHNGKNCYDGLDDINDDGRVDVQDCRGAAGVDGASWLPVMEDGCLVFVNGQDRTEPLCPIPGEQGEPGVPGPAGPQGPQGPAAECTVIGSNNCIIATCNGRSARACVDNDNGEGGSGGAGGNGGEGGNVPPPECQHHSDCTNEPADRCVGDNTLRVYVGNGECQNDGTCYYGFENVNCAYGCANGECNSAPETHDLDGDGYTDVAFGGNDCDDHDASVHPGANDVCGNGVDEDCAYGDLECPDPNQADADGDGYTVGENDCNDAVAGINPGATEGVGQCGNGIDEDCNGGDRECPVEDAGVTIHYSLPAGVATSLISIMGCIGSQIDYSDETDGIHGRLICSSGEWETFESIDEDGNVLTELVAHIAVERGEGFEFNVNFEHLNPSHACGYQWEIYGTLTASSPEDDDMLIMQVDNRQGLHVGDGCNFWVYRW